MKHPPKISLLTSLTVALTFTLSTAISQAGNTINGPIRCGTTGDTYCDTWETCCNMNDGTWACCPHRYGVCCPSSYSCCPVSLSHCHCSTMFLSLTSLHLSREEFAVHAALVGWFCWRINLVSVPFLVRALANDLQEKVRDSKAL